MKIIQTTVILSIALICFMATASEDEVASNLALQSVSNLQWQHRVILVRSDSCDDNVLTNLLAAKAEIDDRQVRWFLLCGQAVVSNHKGIIEDSFASKTGAQYFTQDEVNVVLIGKDGSVKRRADILDLDQLFALIDAMPMRRSEMMGEAK